MEGYDYNKRSRGWRERKTRGIMLAVYTLGALITGYVLIEWVF